LTARSLFWTRPARSIKRGKLQVELAQLKYILPRLIADRTQLFPDWQAVSARGPAKRLETDRRRVRDRLTGWKKKWIMLSRQRQERRKERQRRDVPIVSLGRIHQRWKIHFANTLTRERGLCRKENVRYPRPTSRRLRLPIEREIIINDTSDLSVICRDRGCCFSRDAGRISDSDLLVHVVDAANSQNLSQSNQLIRFERS
jgi:GTP-binding protein HflX